MDGRNRLILVSILLIVLVYWFTLSKRDKHILITTPKEENILATIRNQKSFTKVPILSWNGTWRMDTDMCKQPGPQYRILPLETTTENISMYAYDKNDYISQQIAGGRGFERHIDEIIRYFLNLDPLMNFMDFGANIGVRSLIVGNMGRKVLSVEALGINVELFCASVSVNNYVDKVTIINNAISNKREEVRMAKHNASFGSTFVDRKDYRALVGDQAVGVYDKTVFSITLDDLLQLDIMQHFGKVFIKMDIEGFENKALMGAINFFKNVNVVGIIMEWIVHKGKRSGVEIIDIMKNRNFIPCFDNATVLRQLEFNFEASYLWPHDVLWINSQNKYDYKILPWDAPTTS